MASHKDITSRVVRRLLLSLFSCLALMWCFEGLLDSGALNSLLKLLTVGLFLAWYVATYWTKIDSNLPPGPPRIPSPFHFLLRLIPSGTPLQEIMKITKKYGEIAFVHVGSTKTLIVATPELMRELFVRNADVGTTRAEIAFMKGLAPYEEGGIIFSNGQVWLENRHFLLRALRIFGVGKQSFEKRINAEAQKLCEELDRSVGHPLDPSHLIVMTITNIICSVVLGHSFEYSDGQMKEVMEELAELLEGEIGIKTEVFPFLGTHGSPVRACREMMQKEIREHISTFDENNIRDIIDLYLREVQRLKLANKETTLNPDILWCLMFDIFLGATDTTALGLKWALLFAAGNPDMQEKIYREAERVIGKSETLSFYEHGGKMPYTQAFLQETLRFRPVAGVPCPNFTASDLNIRGYHVPKGTGIMKNLVDISFNPAYWGDPEVFRPERFLSQDGHNFVRSTAFFGFGAGRRKCPGEMVARSEMFMMLVNLIRRFSFRLPDGKAADYGFEHCITTVGPKPYDVVVERR